MDTPIDWEAEGLLEGLTGAGREARITLLERLHGRGATLEHLRTAVDQGRLAAMPAELLLGGLPQYTAREAAAINNLDLDFVLAVRRANGVPVTDPDEHRLTEVDLEVGHATRAVGELGVSAEQIDAAARVLGRSLRQIAEQLGAIVFELSYDDSLDELELSERFAAQVERFEPFIESVVLGGLRINLREAVRDAAVAAAEQTAGDGLPGTRRIGVAFADIVGFTRLGEELPPEQLDGVARRLEALVADVIPRPVRFVKTLGDAAMLVSPDVDALVHAALAVVEAADAASEDFPQLRVGIAAGPAIARGGDWYGRPVNLASRLTSIARAGSVLATREVRDEAGAGLRWSEAGIRRVRGVRDPVPVYRARRADD